MDLAPLLKNFGLPKKEIQAYLAALQLGSQPASIIAEHAHLNRITAYMILKKLVTKGLAQTCYKNGIQYFNVHSPEKLLSYATRKEDEWRIMQEKLKAAIHRMETPKFQNLSPIEVKSFQGVEGFKSIASDLLKCDTLLILSHMDTGRGSYVPYLVEYIFPRLQELSMSIHFILKDSRYTALSMAQFQESSEKKIELLEHMPFDTDLFILDEKVTIFIDKKQEVISGAIIESSAISRSLSASLTAGSPSSHPHQNDSVTLESATDA